MTDFINKQFNHTLQFGKRVLELKHI